MSYFVEDIATGSGFYNFTALALLLYEDCRFLVTINGVSQTIDVIQTRRFKGPIVESVKNMCRYIRNEALPFSTTAKAIAVALNLRVLAGLTNYSSSSPNHHPNNWTAQSKNTWLRTYEHI